MKLISLDKHNFDDAIKEATATLANGGLVIYPTETLYGIGADATSERAIKKLNSYKTMRKDKPYSVMMSDQEVASKYVSLNETAKRLYKMYLPGPYTIISQGKGIVAEGVESPRGTLGVRIADHTFPLELAKVFGKPFTATSANASYKKKPYLIRDVLENISERQKKLIDLIIDAGPLPQRKASTVIDTTLDDILVTRIGDNDLRFQHKTRTTSSQETKELAKKMTEDYMKRIDEKTLIFALEGDMGAGKTQFAKGIGITLNLKRIISPTYNLALEYPFSYENISGMFYHIDTWRMFEKEELLDIGFDNMLKPKNVVVIEWADKYADTIASYGYKALIVWVHIDAVDLNTRIIKF